MNIDDSLSKNYQVVVNLQKKRSIHQFLQTFDLFLNFFLFHLNNSNLYNSISLIDLYASFVVIFDLLQTQTYLCKPTQTYQKRFDIKVRPRDKSHHFSTEHQTKMKLHFGLFYWFIIGFFITESLGDRSLENNCIR